jgi:phage repressor protein C with HTH and peptisase S24 domain
MFTHDDIWRAIDRLAEEKGFSASGLARQAGLDPTAFNRSKRTSPNGKPRWPSTESLAKILSITECSTTAFVQIMDPDAKAPSSTIPLLPYASVRAGRLKGEKAESFSIALDAGRNAFAMRVEDDRLRPLFRAGCLLVAETGVKIAAEDRVLLFSKKEGLKGGILHAAQKRGLAVLLPEHDFRETSFPNSDIEWTARILWASQ